MNIAKSGLLAAALVTLFSPLLRAGGAQEEPLQEGEVRLFLMLGEGESESFGERLYLPSSLALYIWNTFGQRGGQLATEAQGGYRIASRRMVRMEKWNGWTVYGYHLGLNYYSTAGKGSGQIYDLSFTYDRRPSAGSSSSSQPAVRALREGIRLSGRTEGQARLVELRYLDKGRFEARVEVR